MPMSSKRARPGNLTSWMVLQLVNHYRRLDAMYLHMGGARSLLPEKTIHDNGSSPSFAHSPCTNNSNVMTLPAVVNSSQRAMVSFAKHLVTGKWRSSRKLIIGTACVALFTGRSLTARCRRYIPLIKVSRNSSRRISCTNASVYARGAPAQ